MDFCFYLITDRGATAGGRSIEYVLEEAFDAGVRGVLLREKDLPDRELLLLAERLRDLTLRYRARLLVSQRVDVAVAVGADGVQVSSGVPLAPAREKLGEGKYLAVSTHSLDEALQAEDGGADFITLGPVYYTKSKARYGEPVGLGELERACSRLMIPVFGLGGINEDNAVEAMGAGAFGLAAISAVIGAESPGRAARGIMDKIRAYKMRRLI